MSDLSEVSDEILADRVRAGDTDAYGQLWERHSGAARTAARSFASLADPDDLVSESFLQVLRALQRGGGPQEAFRPYVYRTIRNLALNRREATTPTSLELVPDLADDDNLENTVMESTVTVRAFRTLPERWQTVLWYTEVEGMQPAEAAPVLGLTPNAVAALAHRAREGLKKAWLQAHVSSTRVPPGCQWTTQRMGDYARDALSQAARDRFDLHLKSCTRCSILLEEVDDIGQRLASVLLPTVLGGTAAAVLLSESTGTAPASAANIDLPGRDPSAGVGAAKTVSNSRHGLLVAAAIVGVVALGGTAFALSGALTPPPVAAPGSSPPEPESVDPEPSPDPTPKPTTPAPPAPTEPVAPPADDGPPPPVVAPPAPPPAPDLTPPSPAAIATPADGSLGNDARPAIAGSGEPGARVEIEHIGGPAVGGVILSTIVPTNGQWSVTPTTPMPDGTHLLRITQLDAAGNRSVPVDLELTIDTVAAPPGIQPIVGPQRYLPTLAGTAEPSAVVEVFWAGGASIGAVTAAADGAWSIALPDPGPTDSAVTAIQTDLAGNQSAVSDAQSIELQRPDISVPVPDAVVPSTGGSTVVEVRFGGIPGERVQVLIDGVATGNIHTLGASPLIRNTAPLVDGSHTVAVRYVNPESGERGALDVVSFTIE